MCELPHWAFPTPDLDTIILVYVWACLYVSNCTYTCMHRCRPEGTACPVFSEIGSLTGEELSEQGRLDASGLQDPPASASSVLGLQVRVTTPGSRTWTLTLELRSHHLHVKYITDSVSLPAHRYNIVYWKLVYFLQDSWHTSFLLWLHLSN